MKRQRQPYKVYRRRFKGKDGTEQRTRTWYVRFSLAGRIHRCALGARDRTAAELLAAKVYQREELRRSGAVDPFEEQRTRPLAEHVADFETWLRGKGVGQQYVADRLACLRAYIAAAHPRDLAGLDAVPASEWLRSVKDSGLSHRTVNRRYQALRGFGRWLLRNRRWAIDPFETLTPLNEAEDRRHVRRALTADEAARLIVAALERPLATARAERKHAGVTAREEARLRAVGEARGVLYAVALGTGLRRGELRRLRWGDLDLERGNVRVRAESAKARREQAVPLRADLVALLAARRGEARPADSVFPGRAFPNLRTFKRDLLAAGIATAEVGADGKPTGRIVTEGEDGRAVDFHSLRYTFVSGLAAAGVHPRVAQALARHSKIDLTMGLYTDLTLLDTRGAVERLPGSVPVVPALVPETVQSGAAACRSLPAVPAASAEREPASNPAEPALEAAEREGEDGGRYWARTSDPQLVEPSAPPRNPVQERGLRGSRSALCQPLCQESPPSDPLALADALLKAAEAACDPAPLIAAARALLREAGGAAGGECQPRRAVGPA